MSTIGIAAKRSGVGIEAIRYYEREGVIPTAERASNGRRVYDEDAIIRLRFVRRCRDLGFSITQVKALLSLATLKTENCDDANLIGQSHLNDVRHKLADLKLLEAALIGLLANCEGGEANCPMLSQLFDGES